MLSSVNSLRATHQGHLEKVILDSFKGTEIFLNTRKEVDIKNPLTNNPWELDIWFPSLSLGFEFQDAYHFTTVWYSQIPLSQIQENDNIKRECMQKNGILLIYVPCWWDFNPESLYSSIHFARPDLFPQFSSHSSISLNPPENFFANSSVPEIGEVMLASFAETTETFTSSVSKQNPWWIGEKYDGVRALWNPNAQKIFSRRGYHLSVSAAHSSFLSSSCNYFFDSEAWYGRGSYMSFYSAGDCFQNLRMIVFDDPSPASKKFLYEMRYESLLSSVAFNDPFLIMANRKWTESKKDISNFLKNILEESGEGMIAQKPKSFYDSGRSPSLFKIKSSQGDAEALVLNVNHDRSLVLKLPSGIKFEVTKEEVQVEAQIGDIVTFEFDHFSRREEPTNPRVVRIRKDVSWQDTVREYKEDAVYTTKPQRFWDDNNNVRKFLEEFAAKRNLDPYDKETWYQLTRADINAEKGGDAMCAAKGGYVKTVTCAFPEIGIDRTKFSKLPARYLTEVKNRREILIQFAKENNFDPLVADNWYSSSHKHFLEKGAGGVVKYYGSFKEALLHLFPEINLLPRNFEGRYWSRSKSRRQFFDKFAKKHNFDPLIASNWYEISKAQVMAEQHAKAVLYYHERSVVNALLELYPDIGLDRRKFTKKRRDFFDSFSKENNFDPLVASNWYTVTKSDIMKRKNAERVMSYFHGSVIKTLMHVYPTVTFIPENFKMLRSKFWAIEKNRKEFFDDFAKKNSFNPLVAENWYNAHEKILSSKNLSQVLSYYKGNFIKAVTSLYPSVIFEKMKFNVIPGRFWSESKNRREFFENFAKDNKFDPLVPANWYSISRKSILERKNASYVLRYHDDSYTKALADLFPEMNFDPNHLVHLPRRHWMSESNRREFFIRYARDNRFDPLDPEKWYKVSRYKLVTLKGGQAVMSYCAGSYPYTLMSLFPNIGLDPKRFIFPKTSYWSEPENRKELFDSFAKKNKFDPLHARNWYNVQGSHLIATKGSASVLNHYNGSFIEALMDVYPDIGLEKSNFNKGIK